MKCPACQASMVEQDFGGVKVDVCTKGCKGIWFDWFELSKLDEKNEGVGNALCEALEFSRTNDESRGQLKCPKCDLPMHVHKYSASYLVNVDECYTCAGFFLDSGELQVIRENYMNDQEQDQYLGQLLKGIPGYQAGKDDIKKTEARTAAIRKMTRFIRPSYLFNVYKERKK